MRMVNQEFEIILAFSAIAAGMGMLWMARSQAD
jgi:hypothetical protein